MMAMHPMFRVFRMRTLSDGGKVGGLQLSVSILSNVTVRSQQAAVRSFMSGSSAVT